MPLEHKEIVERFTFDWNNDRDNRDDALDDLKFMAGDQWDDDARQRRELEFKPVITVNRMGSFVRQVSGDLRQSAPAIDPIPVDGNTDEVLAEIYGGLIRQIEYRSGAAAVYAHGTEMSIACGIGHWRVDTGFIDDAVFDQEIKLKRIVDPLSVIWDGAAVELDRSDAMHCFVTELMPTKMFNEKFPEAAQADFPSGISHSQSSLYWRNSDVTRIAEYWRLEPVKKTLGLTQDGATIDLTDMEDDQVRFLGVTRTREVDSHKIVHQMISGNDFLTEEKEWAGRFIPIVPVIGNEIPLDGKCIRHGLIRWAKDPQRLYNYWRSAAAEVIGSSPKAPWLGTTAMFKGKENFWNKANTSTLPYLPYNIDPEAPTARPERQQPPTPPAAMWTEAQVAQDDMKATTNIFDDSQGVEGNAKSGRAIIARQNQGAIGSFVYFDNFNHAIRRTGEILVDLIPKIYDGERTVRILGKDETESFAQINKTVLTNDGEEIMVNDLSTARFDVRIKTGPSYASAKLEAREQLTEMVQANPNLWSVIGDLIVETMDFPGSDKIAERLKKTMDPAIVGDEDEPQPVDPIAEAAQRINMALAELEVEKAEAEVEKIEAQTDQIQADTIIKAEETEIKKDTLDLKAIEMGANSSPQSDATRP